MKFEFDRVYAKLIRLIEQDTSKVVGNQDTSSVVSDHLSKDEVRNLVMLVRKVLYQTSRYFWYILKDMPIIIVSPDNKQIRTGAVDQYRNLYLNPRFVQEILSDHLDENGNIKIQDDPFTFLIAHEIYHIINRTFERQGDRDAMIQYPDGRQVSLWNVATDFEMNDILKWKFNLKSPTKAGKEVGLQTDEKGFAEFAGHKYKIRGKPAERIYAEIAANTPKSKDKQPQSGKGDDKVEIGDIIKQRGSDTYGEVTDIINDEVIITPLTKEEAYDRVKKQ